MGVLAVHGERLIHFRRPLLLQLKKISDMGQILNRDCVNIRGLDLSKDVLWVYVG